MFFAKDFNQLTRIPPQNIARSGNSQHADRNLMITPANIDLVSGFDRVRGLSWSPVKQDKARVAKLLG